MISYLTLMLAEAAVFSEKFLPIVRRKLTGSVRRSGALLVVGGLATAALHAQDAAAPAPSRLTQTYVEGQNAFNQGDYQKAIQNMQTVLSEAAADSPLESVYYTLGAAQFNVRNYPAAIEALQTFLTKFPKSDKLNDVIYFLGESQMQAKDLDAAAQTFTALESKPAYRDRVLFQLGAAYKDAGDVDRGIATLKKLVDGGLNSTEASNGAMMLSALYAQKGDYDRAFELLKKIRQNSDMPDNVVRMNSMAIELGDSLLKAEKAEQALRSYQLVQTKAEIIRLQGERIDKMQRRVDANLVVLRADPGKAPEITAANNALRASIEQTRKQLADFQKAPDFESPFWLRVAQAYYGIGQKWETAAIYDELLRREPQGAEREPALFGLLVVSGELNRGPRGRALGETYLKEFPTTPNANTAGYLLGATALKDGDMPAAESYFGSMLDKQPDSSYREQMMFLLGNSRFGLGKFDQAAADYAKYVENYPAGSYKEDAVYRQALAALFAGKYAPAVKQFNEYFIAYPQGQYVSDAKYRLAVCKFAASDFDGVLTDTDAWAKAYPNDPMLGETLALRGDAYAGLAGRETEAIDTYIASAKAAKSDEVLNHSLFEAAKLMQKQGDWQKIGAVFQEFIDHHPASAVVVPAVFWLGKAKVKEGKIDEAKKIVADAIQKNIADPAQPAVEQLITQLAQFSARKKPAAAAGVPAAPETDPAAELGALLSADQQTAPAAKARVLFAKSELARLRKDPAEQEKELGEIAATIKPEDLSPALLALVGDSLLGKNDDDRAAAFFQALMDDYPKSDYLDFAYNGFGQIAFARQDYPKALQFFTDAIDKAGATIKLKDVTLGQAKTLLAMGRLDEAEKLFKQIASTREWRGDATALSVYSLGEIEEKRSKLPEAIAYYQRVFVAYGRYLPWVAKAYIRSAECFDRLGKKPEALNTYRELLRNQKLSAFPEFEEARKKVEAEGNG